MIQGRISGESRVAGSAIHMRGLSIQSTNLADVKIIVPPRYQDSRGCFCESYNKRALAAAGIVLEFVQDNYSLSAKRGVVRGLHFQVNPFAQDKLIRVVRGAIFDVAVDLRPASLTWGRHVSALLSADEGNQILVPKGYAHGFCTLEPNTEVAYKVTSYYAREHERGLLWNDPELGIAWPITPAEAILSDRDRHFPRLADLRDNS